MIFTDRHIVSLFNSCVSAVLKNNTYDIYCAKKKKLPKVTVSAGVLQPKSSLHIIAAAHDTLSKSLEPSKTSTVERIDKSINTTTKAELANVSQNFIATYNTELSLGFDNSSEQNKSQHFENRNITPPTMHSPSYPNDSHFNLWLRKVR